MRPETIANMSMMPGEIQSRVAFQPAKCRELLQCAKHYVNKCECKQDLNHSHCALQLVPRSIGSVTSVAGIA
jgi:hypothetical protein